MMKLLRLNPIHRAPASPQPAAIRLGPARKAAARNAGKLKNILPRLNGNYRLELVSKARVDIEDPDTVNLSYVLHPQLGNLLLWMTLFSFIIAYPAVKYAGLTGVVAGFVLINGISVATLLHGLSKELR